MDTTIIPKNIKIDEKWSLGNFSHNKKRPFHSALRYSFFPVTFEVNNKVLKAKIRSNAKVLNGREHTSLVLELEDKGFESALDAIGISFDKTQIFKQFLKQSRVQYKEYKQKLRDAIAEKWDTFHIVQTKDEIEAEIHKLKQNAVVTFSRGKDEYMKNMLSYASCSPTLKVDYRWRDSLGRECEAYVCIEFNTTAYKLVNFSTYEKNQRGHGFKKISSVAVAVSEYFNNQIDRIEGTISCDNYLTKKNSFVVESLKEFANDLYIDGDYFVLQATDKAGYYRGVRFHIYDFENGTGKFVVKGIQGTLELEALKSIIKIALESGEGEYVYIDGKQKMLTNE